LTTKIPALPDDILNVTIEAVDGGRPALRVQHLVSLILYQNLIENLAANSNIC
jgi:hypothetical protein